ncbi:hypothetical protein [Lewinella sp. IMCC34191]|uniref:hypothetical protein n=1 Tax=Lewinella sp. IMCC34191 TaxID=2259172 RepID=UPI000E23FB6C|nr:hypothetical protein [Lewinella sp. IMCC34191]
MRIFLPLIVLLLIVHVGHAQVAYKQGTVYLDGGSTLTVRNGSLLRSENAFSNPSAPEVSRVGGTSSPVGVFAFDRLLVGVRAGYSHTWYGDSFFNGAAGSSENYRVNPFVRYYILAGEERKWNLFAELGFGTFGGGNLPSFETDFHVGAGVDVPLLPGVVGTARLAYNANASGLNFTTLDVGGNLLLGQLNPVVEVPLAKGTWTTQGRLINASFGHMRRGNNNWTSYTYRFTPALGYFVLDGLLISSASSLTVTGEQNDLSSAWVTTRNERQHHLETELAARYYPWRGGKLLPFAAVSVGFRYSSLDREDNPSDLQSSSTILAASAGISYFLGDNVALEVAAEYQQSNNRGADFAVADPTSKFRQISLDTGFAFYFGR